MITCWPTWPTGRRAPGSLATRGPLIDPDALSAALRPGDDHSPRSAAVALEITHATVGSLARNGVRAKTYGGRWVRLVTHKDVSDEDLHAALAAIERTVRHVLRSLTLAPASAVREPPSPSAGRCRVLRRRRRCRLPAHAVQGNDLPPPSSGCGMPLLA